MRLIGFFCVLSLALGLNEGAQAHAIVVFSSPRADESVQGDELPVEIRFNSRIDAARSRLQLFKIDGGAVALPVLDAESLDRLKAKATGLKPGAYRLHWQTLSPDGHITQGDIPFAVGR